MSANQTWHVDNTWQVLLIHFIWGQKVKCEGHSVSCRCVSCWKHYAAYSGDTWRIEIILLKKLKYKIRPALKKPWTYGHQTWQLDSTWQVLVTHFIWGQKVVSRSTWVCTLLSASTLLTSYLCTIYPQFQQKLIVRVNVIWFKEFNQNWYFHRFVYLNISNCTVCTVLKHFTWILWCACMWRVYTCLFVYIIDFLQ